MGPPWRSSSFSPIFARKPESLVLTRDVLWVWGGRGVFKPVGCRLRDSAAPCGCWHSSEFLSYGLTLRPSLRLSGRRSLRIVISVAGMALWRVHSATAQARTPYMPITAKKESEHREDRDQAGLKLWLRGGFRDQIRHGRHRLYPAGSYPSPARRPQRMAVAILAWLSSGAYSSEGHARLINSALSPVRKVDASRCVHHPR